MPRYFMHLRDSTDVIVDPEGVELSAAAVERAALKAARDCMADDVQNGWLDLRYQIDVHDESDGVVHCLRFADAVKILRADA